jgi:hypothetical protein
MKTEKKRYTFWFSYREIKTGLYHGFYNQENIYIGYNYQGNYKGFWLDYEKE